MSREDTALACGIYGLTKHLLAPLLLSHTHPWQSWLTQPVPAAARLLASPFPALLSLHVLTPVFGAGWQTRLVGGCGIHAAITDIFVPATIFQLWSKASSGSGAVSRAGLLSILGDDASPPATAPHKAPGSDGAPCSASLVCVRLWCIHAAPARTGA